MAGSEAQALYSSPTGDLIVRAVAQGLRYVAFTSEPGRPRGVSSRIIGAVSDPDGARETARAGAILEQALVELAEYFAGSRRRFDVQLDLQGTEFQTRVWTELRQIPYGATMTYRELATAAGRPAAIRAAGAANGANPISIIVPCHRVIGSHGSLTGYAGGIEIKRRLLELERSGAAPEAH